MDGKIILTETQSEFKQKYETAEKRPPLRDSRVLGKLAEEDVSTFLEAQTAIAEKRESSRVAEETSLNSFS